MSKVFKIAIDKMKIHTIIPIFLIIFLGCSIFINNFFSLSNMSNILSQNAAKGVLAVGMTFVVINGYFDLSVGSLMGLSSCLTIGLTPIIGLVPSILIAILIGLIVGLLNGLLITKAGINAFVVTLAEMIGIRGIVYIYTEKTLSGTSKLFYEFGKGSFIGIPNLVWIMLIFFAAGQAILHLTKQGRNTYAAGGNMNAAKNAGINVDKTIIGNFLFCSFSSAIAGIMYASKFNSASPTLGWPDTPVLAIAAVVLGGTKLSGGYGNMFYTFGGLITLGMVDNAMNLLKISSYFNTLITGIILILVLYLDKVIREK